MQNLQPRLIIALIVASLVFVPLAVFAQADSTPADSPEPLYLRAKVLEILEERTQSAEGVNSPVQTVRVRVLHGSQRGQAVTIQHGETYTIQPSQRVRQGQTVIVLMNPPEGTPVIVDFWRLPAVVFVAALFALAVLLIGRKRGLTAILGLASTVLILVLYVFPALLRGTSPLQVALLASILILSVSLFIAHGFNRRTTVAFAASLVTLGLALGISELFVRLTLLTGFGSEDAASLQFGALGTINARGLLLAGMLLGMVGVLDDVTVSQTATVGELHLANPGQTAQALMRQGLKVGREHIASLVNTLALAYVAAALPLLLSFAAIQNQPAWLTFNSEFVVEEIVRTLTGSLTLVLAVPIATVLAVRLIPPARKSRGLPTTVTGESPGPTPAD